MNPYVQITDNDDGSARLTVAINGHNHRFSLGSNGHLVFEETLLHRGVVRSPKPREAVYKAVAQSDEVTAWMDRHDIDSISRER